MTDREQQEALRTLLAEELGDDWQPHSIRVNRLSYRERQQLKNGPDADFITEKLDEARRGQKRASIAAGVGLALVFVYIFVPFDLVANSWETLAHVLWICVDFGLVAFGTLRHMHWRKRAMIYRAFRLLNGEREPATAHETGDARIAA